MKRLDSLGAEIATAEHLVLERRILLRLRSRALAAHARRRLASPVALMAAAGAGFLLASRRGRSGIGKIFAALQLGLAALSAFAAAK
jgi:hypothetical protein